MHGCCLVFNQIVICRKDPAEPSRIQQVKSQVESTNFVEVPTAKESRKSILDKYDGER